MDPAAWKNVAFTLLGKLGGELTISKREFEGVLDPAIDITAFEDVRGNVHVFLTKNGQRWKP
jgi:hypothetical protein